MRVVMTKPQADHLAMHLQNMPTERPMTYSLMAGLLQALRGRLVEARITRTDRNTIYANAIIEGAYGRQVLDDRPSDAINLAIRTGAPIRVMPDVLEAMQIPGNEDGATGIEWA
jgi:bifunctional DNase/RNase